MEKIKKSRKRFEVEKLVQVVLRKKTVVQQYGVETLNASLIIIIIIIIIIILIKMTRRVSNCSKMRQCCQCI